MSNLPNVQFVAEKLAELKDEVVFVGGAIVELLLDKTYPLSPRMSEDVDTIIEVYSRGAFAKIEKKLRSLGFQHVMTGPREKAVICRFEIEGVTLDLMPTEPNILGFSNRWYESAFKKAQMFYLSETLTIQLITAPYFLGTKLEAFLGRGNQDYHASHDLEDIITVLDGRENIIEEVSASEEDLQAYLRQECSNILAAPQFLNALPGHLSPYGEQVDYRVDRILSRFKTLSEGVNA